MAHILVIGGAGYIGSHVVKALLDNGHQVLVYDNFSTGQRINLFEKAEIIEGDISDKIALENAMKQNIDIVIHLAAKKAVGESMINPALYAENNILGSVNILNAMVKNNVKHIIFSSSAAVYGIPEFLPVDESHPKNPMNFYGYTKVAIEDLISWYAKLQKLNYIIFRFFNAVGYDKSGAVRGKEKNPQNLLPIIMEAATRKRDGFEIFGNDYDTKDGTCERDYIHVSDLASAHVKAVRKILTDSNSYTLNLGTGQAVSVQQIADATEKVIRKKLKYRISDRRPGDPAKLVASSKKAAEVLGWQPEYTEISDIIQTVWNMEN